MSFNPGGITISESALISSPGAQLKLVLVASFSHMLAAPTLRIQNIPARYVTALLVTNQDSILIMSRANYFSYRGAISPRKDTP